MRLIVTTILIVIYSLVHGQNDYQRFCKSDLLTDLEVLYQHAAQIHPRLAVKVQFDEFTKLYEWQKANISDSLNLNEFYLIAAPLLAWLNDAHSNVLPPNNPRIEYMLQKNGLSFPFDVSIRDDTVFLAHYFGSSEIDINKKKPIKSINRTPVSDFLSDMRRLTGAKKKSIQNVTIERNFRLYLWMIYGFENDYDIVFQDDRRVKIAGVDNTTFLKNKLSPKVEDYSLNIDTLQNVAVLKIRTFANLENFLPFIDSAFAVLKSEHYRTLVIDVRDNMGGRSVVVDSLMNYLTEKPYRQYKTIRTRVSEPLKRYYQNRPEKLKLIADYTSDTLIVNNGTEMLPHKKNSRFKGQLFVKVNERTFSAAATFAGLIKHMGIGKIVGEETGGTIGYYGDFWFQQLPHTKLTYYIAPKEFVQFGGDDLAHGVLPTDDCLNVDFKKSK